MRSRHQQKLGGDRERAELSRTSELAQLADLDLDDLRQRWRRFFGKPAPANLTRQLLLRILAYHLQVAAHGDLSQATKKLLQQVGRDAGPADAGGQGVVPPPPELRPLLSGTLLVREHEGVLHRVMVLDEGFAWNGNVYPSLSKIARAITGTSWNGPRFFGLRQEVRRAAKPQRKAGCETVPGPGKRSRGHRPVSAETSA